MWNSMFDELAHGKLHEIVTRIRLVGVVVCRVNQPIGVKHANLSRTELLLIVFFITQIVSQVLSFKTEASTKSGKPDCDAQVIRTKTHCKLKELASGLMKLREFA